MTEQLPPSYIDATTAARLEAKLDVAIAQHSVRLDNHEHAIGELKQENREQDQRITANTVSISEVRSTAATHQETRKALPSWAGVVITAMSLIVALVAVFIR